jgi:hypothetical protein
MSERDFRFISGYETSTEPTSTSPTVGTDIATRKYCEDNLTQVNSTNYNALATLIKKVKVRNYKEHSASEANTWRSVAWSPTLKMFAAISSDGTNRVMTSSDGSIWTSRTVTATNSWYGICWSPTAQGGCFCAVGYGTTNYVMTSVDGINWSYQTAPAYNWSSVCWSAYLGLFCAVSYDASGGTMPGSMISVNGITWSSTTDLYGRMHTGVCWSSTLNAFCAVNRSYTKFATSTNGTVWTLSNSITMDDYYSVCWSPYLNLFCAVGTGTSKVITSPTGATWTVRDIAGSALAAVEWSEDLKSFCAIGTGTYAVRTSSDGLTWTNRPVITTAGWNGICYAPELMKFCGVSTSGTNRVLTSL